MNDEEKKAIEYLKQNNIVEIQYDNYGLESIHRVGIDEKQTILNLIEKQSKEIESLKEDNKKKSIVIIEYQDLYEKLEDKIKAKIEELEKDFKEYENGQEWEIQDEIRGQIEVLQSLLEKE